jgi:DHA1 family multidrug resistance protein-like MFS transporter
MSSWRRTYISIWISQFISIVGFAYALPFSPYYIQELGVTDPVQLRIWVALFAAATPLTLAISSPLWGAASDKFGHRLMMLRATFCATVVLGLMGLVKNVESLIFLRLLQGALTGTFTASQIMVATYAPPERSGRALGSLSAAVFSGAMFGAFFGGLTSSFFGYRTVFFIGSGLLLLSALIILFGTAEERTAPDSAVTHDPENGNSPSRNAFLLAIPILALIAGVSLVRQFDMAMMPLLVQEIYGSLEGVSIYTGILFAISGVAGFMASTWMGRLSDRVHPARIGLLSTIGAALAVIPMGIATSLWVLYPARFAMMFGAGGLEATSQIWLSKVTPKEHKGLIFGWASTARSIGWVAAPLISGGIAAGFGLRPVYYVNAALFLMMIPLILWTRKRMSTPA